jgi:hypothetical protein
MELVHLFLTVKVTSKKGEAAELQKKAILLYIHGRLLAWNTLRERESRECEGNQSFRSVACVRQCGALCRTLLTVYPCVRGSTCLFCSIPWSALSKSDPTTDGGKDGGDSWSTGGGSRGLTVVSGQRGGGAAVVLPFERACPNVSSGSSSPSARATPGIPTTQPLATARSICWHSCRRVVAGAEGERLGQLVDAGVPSCISCRGCARISKPDFADAILV